MGRKKKYESGDEFAAAVQAYVNGCKEEGEFPDDAGMMNYLGVTENTLKRYQEGEDEFATKVKAVLYWAAKERESFLARRMAREPKLAQGCMNLLKQQKNGGYLDKPVDNGERTLTINLVGIGGGVNAFK